MDKVIVERPRRRRTRHGYGSDYPRGSLEAHLGGRLEDAPSREPMGGRYATKWLNENLQPLVRFLRTHAGRPWDDVHAEISARVRCTSAVQKHVLDHLRDFVEEHAVVDENGHPLRRSYRGLEPLVSRGMRLRFYVCPRTRRLLLAPTERRKRHAPPPDPNVRVLGDGRELRRIAGVWYAVDLAPDPRDARAPLVVVKKRQLGKRELRRLDLTSPPSPSSAKGP